MLQEVQISVTHVEMQSNLVVLDQEDSRRRLAALSLSSLLNRCRTTLVGYVADEALRGNLPFPRFVHMPSSPGKPFTSSFRAKEEQLLYVLRKILGLRLWPGSLWAALSDNPTQYCLKQPGNSSAFLANLRQLNPLDPISISC